MNSFIGMKLLLFRSVLLNSGNLVYRFDITNFKANELFK